MKNNTHLVWLDLEMTGLDAQRDHIIEIATVVTDSQLNIVAEGPVFAIHQPQALLDQMDSWNTKQHNSSGLVKRVQESQITVEEAQQKTLAFLSQYLDKNKSPLCGNSVWQDRRFLMKYMPELASFFFYRNLDVSTLKELALRWRPALLKGFEKASKHLALDDIKDSIAELIYYREHFINLSENN
jgi:oligoribonuclease